MDKEKFGAFIAERRKALDMTQKELADRLMISDKAVSKWERGLSFPDITLIEPLAHILSVSLTELMEGSSKTMEEKYTKEEVDDIIKKTVDAGKEEREMEKSMRLSERIIVAVVTTLVVALEIYVLYLVGINWEIASTHLFTVVGLTLAFGIYFWVFAKEKLPTYYDENKISMYSDGIFRMNIPGVHFNNSNWKHILQGLRIWCVAVSVAYPMLTLALDRFFPVSGYGTFAYLALTLVVVFSMFIPIAYCGRKYG
ncbi:MAG: helix-turn-helix transcriptional regulator [Lachnospiraceae bacterium]|nr:helix-turn-helix transcriptional regulator [Lachnospiraceae bacterium]